jgi:hypothetical protein
MNRIVVWLFLAASFSLCLTGCGTADEEESSPPPPTVTPVSTTAITVSEPTPTLVLPTPTLAEARPPTATPAIKMTLPPLAELVPTETPTPAAKATPTATPVMEQVVEQGGYAFWPPWGYDMRRNAGETVFTNEGGVMLLAGGADQNPARSPDQVLGEILGAINQSMVASMQNGPAYPVSIGGLAGQGSDLSGSAAIGPMLGRLVTLKPAEGQIFYAFAMSPAESWTARGARDFDRLIQGVRFIPMGSSFGCPQSLDPTYGFSPENPIRIGGGAASQAREEQYLKTLLGPLGQLVSYERVGQESHGDGLLSIYRLNFAQLEQPLMLYLDANSYGSPFAPVGFRCNGPFTLAPP